MPRIIVFLLSMSPISELRGAIPLGVFHYNLGLLETVLISLFGNILISLLIVLGLNYVLDHLIKLIPSLGKLANWFFAITRKRHQRKFSKWQDLALVIIVAIPLPFTGAWTGSLASYVFGVPPKRAFSLIALGVSIAALIVTILTINGIRLFE
jgi:uncharacterized membrane protein